jgi:DNA-binding NtrC family response regulator
MDLELFLLIGSRFGQDLDLVLERRHILGVLKEVNGNREEAARRLGISRKTIDRKCALWDV